MPTIKDRKTLVESEVNNFSIEKYVLFHHGVGFEPVHPTCFTISIDLDSKVDDPCQWSSTKMKGFNVTN